MKRELAGLYPPLREWFEQRYGSLSDVQKLALPHTLRGENTLILAPTGSGKTLAAFLSCLSRLGEMAAAGELPSAVCVVYVSPLRSLDRDIHRNLTPVAEALNATLPVSRHIRVDVRTGDTAMDERARQLRRPPHILLTTVESVSAIVSQVGWRETLRPFVVIVDEIHAFAESKRGTLLSLTLERLEAKAGRALQRIGLSATAHPVEAVTSLLTGDRPCAVAALDTRKSYRLTIANPVEGNLPPAGFNAFRVAHTVAGLVEKAQCSLVFTTTRSAAERLGLALKYLLPDEEPRIAVHHGSIDRQERESIESLLSTGDMKAVVCSSSLELGVDFKAVDQVVLIGAPRGVSRTLQRLGRSGHRVGGVAMGVLVPLNSLDLIECIALCRGVAEGHLDPLRPPRAPLDVLAQVLLGMAVDGTFTLDQAFALVRRAGPYRTLTREEFDLVVDYLCGGGQVLAKYGKVMVAEGVLKVTSRKVARDYYMNIGTISADFAMRIVDKRNRHLGSVEEAFVGSLRPNEAFLVGGKPVKVTKLYQNMAIVEPATGERIQTPRWAGNKMPLSAELAAQELRLRRALRPLAEAQDWRGLERLLVKEWKTPLEVAAHAVRFLERQQRVAPVPVDDPVQAELVPDGRAMVMHFHVLAGRAVNRSLAWAVAHRLRPDGSIVANFDDHAFMLSMHPRDVPSWDEVRNCFRPDGFLEDLNEVIRTTESVGFGFRRIAETGQLLPKRTDRGNRTPKAQTWNGSLLYNTLRTYEPDHPLVREAVRDIIEDQMDGERAQQECARIYESPWETFSHSRPSPFALPLYAAFNREILLAADPEKALDDFLASLTTDPVAS